MIEKVHLCEGEAGGKNVLFHLPKHIMQIGSGGTVPEIYIEDYAYGYLGRLAANDSTVCRVAVLVGEFMKSEGKRYVFIRGAIEAENAVEENVPKFSSEIWADVYGKIKRFFPNYEAVGWFLCGPGYLTEVNDTIRQTHLDWFGGRDRVFYRLDPAEKESAFYLYDNGELAKWPGYCVYYEKNEEMQDFMVAGKPQSVDVGYEEPVLVRMSRCLGRKTDTDGAENPGQTVSDETEKNEEIPEMQEKKDEPVPALQKAGKSGRFGNGIVAAAALFAIAAVGIRFNQNRQGPAAVPTARLLPTPNGGTYLEETGAHPTGELAHQTGEAADLTGDAKQPVIHTEDGDSFFGGDFESQFHLTDEPILPTKKLPTPTKTPSKAPTKAPTKTPTKAPTKKPTVTPKLTAALTATPALTPTAVPKPTKTAETGSLPGMLYVIKSGDTLAAICKRFYGDVSRMEEVKEVNQIADENKIYAGQEIYLP